MVGPALLPLSVVQETGPAVAVIGLQSAGSQT
jgi:hypothetical protein